MTQGGNDGARRQATPFVLRYVPALDGLRGLAVAGVVAYHGGHLTGGYLGVDLFFVLSGFLITALLLREWGGTGRVGLRRFWERRARRLLPALLAVLVAVAVYARVWATPYELATIRGDAVATITYVANWRAVLSGQSYWAQYTAPSPLRHTWSLAIEEQLYVVWPLLVLIVALRVTRRQRRRAADVDADAVTADGDAVPRGRGPEVARAVFVVAVVLALASWIWLLLGSLRGVDDSRLYMGTDTRAGSALAGAALAAWFAWRGWGLTPADHRAGDEGRKRAAVRWALEAGALVSLAWMAYAWTTIEGTADALYRGLIPLSAIASVTVIGAVTHPRQASVAAALSWRPLRALGLISYGLYLWHWPVFVVLQQQHMRLGLDGWLLFAVKVAVSLAFAVVSFFVLERPIRRHGLLAWGAAGRRLMPMAAVVTVVLVAAATVGGRDQVELAYQGTNADGTASLPPLPVAPADPVPGSTSTTAPPVTVAPDGQSPPPRAVEGPIARPVNRHPRLLVVGDSVALYLGQGIAAQPELQIDVGNRAMYKCTLGRAEGVWQRPGEAPDSESPDCREWETIWGDAIKTFKPDAVLLEFGGPPQGSLRIDGTYEAPCSEPFRRYLQGEAEAAVQLLTSQGATLFFAMTAHERFPWLPPDIDERVDCVNAVYRTVAEAHPDRVRLVRLDSWVCPDGKDCVDEIDGVPLRDDGIHYRDGGALVAGRWVAGQILLPPTTAAATAVLPPAPAGVSAPEIAASPR